VDRMEADPYEVIEDGDHVEVDAERGEVRVRKKAA